MKLIRLALALSTALFLCACLPPTTKTPIGSTVGFKPDAALLGMWRAEGKDKNDEPAYFAFLKNDDGSMTAILVEAPSNPEATRGDWSSYALDVAQLGGSTFLNARPMLSDGNGKVGDDSDPKQIFPLLYRLSQGTLAFYFLKDDAVKEAVSKGWLKGTIDPGKDGDVHITEDGAKLDAFMQTDKGLAMFEKEPAAVLHRVE